ncbi:MAG: chromate resistance protein ChrB domain-containing protein [Geminicoccaceae bacterium]
MGKFLITPEQLWSCLAGLNPPRIVDVRRHEIFASDNHLVPGAVWRDHRQTESWQTEFDAGAELVIYCVHSHNVSQLAAAQLRSNGLRARILKDGIEAWREAGLPLLKKSTLPLTFERGPSVWVTRRRPKIDRLACPWLIKRFIDPRAKILFVDPDHVLAVAEETGGISFDIEGAEISHEGDLCSFDVLLRRCGLKDATLDDLALIIRGADTARFDLADEAAGLLATAIGISALAGEDDHLALARGMDLYDNLYAWRRKAPSEMHNWPSVARS